MEEFSQRTGIPVSTLKKYESNHRVPGGEALQAMASAGIDVHWLVTGEGAMLLTDPGRDARGTPTAGIGGNGEDYALVPLYNLRVAASHGPEGRGRAIDHLAFKKDWLSRELQVSVADLYLIKMDGESMIPTLHPGDLILADRRDADAIPHEGIYILRMDDSLLVKRLQRLPRRLLKVTSDNPAYAPFDLDMESAASEFRVVGRVVWAGRRM